MATTTPMAQPKEITFPVATNTAKPRVTIKPASQPKQDTTAKEEMSVWDRIKAVFQDAPASPVKQTPVPVVITVEPTNRQPANPAVQPPLTTQPIQQEQRDQQERPTTLAYLKPVQPVMPPRIELQTSPNRQKPILTNRSRQTPMVDPISTTTASVEKQPTTAQPLTATQQAARQAALNTPALPRSPLDTMLRPPSKTHMVLTSTSQKTEGPHILQLSSTDIRNARAQLMAMISRDLKQRHIPVQVDSQSGTLYLPKLLDYSSTATKNRQGMREVANVLANNLFCFSRDANQAEECSAIGHSIKLDAMVIVGNAGPQPVGSKPFQQKWQQANSQALKTFAALLKAHPRMSGLRNNLDQSIFRLDGYLPANKSNKTRPMRRVELRFVMEPPSIESQPNP